MTIDDYIKIDSTFDEAVFLSKVGNMIIKYYSSITFNKMDTIDHFVSDSIFNDGKKEIEECKNKHIIHMYDMLNVKDSRILSIDEVDDNYIIRVAITLRYLDYYIDEVSRKKVSGNDRDRIEIPCIIELSKPINSKEQKLLKKCPNCGASLLINASGKCEYCGSIYNLEDYDYIITKIEKS